MKKLSQMLMKIKISTMIEPKWQRRHFFSLASDQDLAEQLDLMERFLTEKGAGLFQIQVVHLLYVHGKIQQSNLYLKKYTYYNRSRTAVFTFLDITYLSINEHQFFGYDVLR